MELCVDFLNTASVLIFFRSKFSCALCFGSRSIHCNHFCALILIILFRGRSDWRKRHYGQHAGAATSHFTHHTPTPHTSRTTPPHLTLHAPHPHTSYPSQLESPMLRGMMFRMPGHAASRSHAGAQMLQMHHHMNYAHGLQSMHDAHLQQVMCLPS